MSGLLVPLVMMLALPVFAFGQRPPSELQVHFGLAAFPNGSFFDNKHFAVGTAYRFPLSHRFAVQPEFSYLYGGSSDRDYVFAVQAVRDVGPPLRGAQTYVIGGGGVMHHRGRYRTANVLVLRIGAGVRVPLGERFYIAPEFRIGGGEPFASFSAAIGYRFGR